MTKELEKLLKQIFALQIEVNTRTKYKVKLDVQPVFNTDQIWFGVWENEDDWGMSDLGYAGCAFTNDFESCMDTLTKFRYKLKSILKENGGIK